MKLRERAPYIRNRVTCRPLFECSLSKRVSLVDQCLYIEHTEERTDDRYSNDKEMEKILAMAAVKTTWVESPFGYPGRVLRMQYHSTLAVPDFFFCAK